MATNKFGFDPARLTSARLQTEGWMKFTNPPEEVFALLADHKGMTQWLPLLKKVTVTHPKPLAPGESTVGTARKMVFEGGITLVETVVLWNPPLCYAYDTKGEHFPLENYIGFMGVEPNKTGGGKFIFREYFDVQGRLKRAILPRGVVPPMRMAFKKLSKLIGGTEHDIGHVKAPR